MTDYDKQREEGYYWVCYEGDWDISYYTFNRNNLWGWIGTKDSNLVVLIPTDVFDEIDENQIKRGNS